MDVCHLLLVEANLSTEILSYWGENQLSYILWSS